jgi:hypothetical protein
MRLLRKNCMVHNDAEYVIAEVWSENGTKAHEILAALAGIVRFGARALLCCGPGSAGAREASSDGDDRESATAWPGQAVAIAGCAGHN